jgi:hypothetical protein
LTLHVTLLATRHENAVSLAAAAFQHNARHWRRHAQPSAKKSPQRKYRPSVATCYM